MGKKKEEITEEVVQAVSVGIVEEAKENNKDVKEVVDEIVEEAKEDSFEVKETIDLRGFKTIEDAKNYPNTPEFKKLDNGCKTEYQEWLKSILKED